MKWNILALEIFAIVGSYLIITIPVIGATQVNVYYQGEPKATINLDYSKAVKESVTVNNPGTSASVNLSVDNATSEFVILEAHVYKCGGAEPVACASGSGKTAATKYEGSFVAEYQWSEVTNQQSGYPQKANIMTVVKVKKGGRLFWIGYWDVVTRSSESSFSVEQRGIDEININATKTEYISTIDSFVRNFMIPINPKWVSKVVFTTASGLQLLRSSDMPTFDGETVAGNEMLSASKNFTFVAPKSSDIMGIATVNLNPDYTCGNDACETDAGEGEYNCCYDCSCTRAGYYCDASMFCRLESGITMSLLGSPDTRVVNCNDDHVIYIPVKIANFPADAKVTKSSYKLGSSVNSVSCAKGPGGVFSCPVTVPAVTDCNTGTYSVGPNRIDLTIQYSNGTKTSTKSLSVAFPDVTIGSFQCGNGVCESSLGEDQSKCCYDCGCPSGKYCDWDGSNKTDSSCRPPLVNTDLYMASINPAHFYDQPAGGNLANITINIKNKPLGLQLESLDCRMSCTTPNETCQATCYLQSCAQNVVSGVYSTTCKMTFIVSGYDSLTDYDLSPVFTANLSYNNGTGSVDASLVSTFPKISIGAHWCGDRTCGSDESASTCCYDCGCPSGQYCKTSSTAGPSESDSCHAKDFTFSSDPLGDTLLQDSAKKHYINVTGKITGYPPGTELAGDCWIPVKDCDLLCSRVVAGEDEYGFLCQMVLPPIDYVGSQYYDSDTRLLTFPSSSYSITHIYNEGPNMINETHNFTGGEIIFNVTSHCGEGGCEAHLGETQQECCRDCGCGDYGDSYFCYTGENPNGACLPNSSILLNVTGFEPDVTDCIIYEEGKVCIATTNTLMNAMIINPPSDIFLVESFYTAGEQNNTPISCYELGDGTYTCPFALDKFKGDTTEGSQSVPVSLIMTVGYSIDGVTMTQSIQGTTDMSVKTAISSAIMSCKKMKESYQTQMDSLQKSKTMSNVFAIILLVLGAVFLALAIACFDTTGLTWGADMAACVALLALSLTCITAALSMFQAAKGQEQQMLALQQQMEAKEEMCKAQTTADMSAAEMRLGKITIPVVEKS